VQWGKGPAARAHAYVLVTVPNTMQASKIDFAYAGPAMYRECHGKKII
jgi:hypothetical protein